MKLLLPCTILPVSARDEVARRLGISVDDVVAIAHGERAWRDGATIDEPQFWDTYPDDDFDDFTGPRVLPADLLVHELEVARDPAATLTPPISAADVLAADVLALTDYARSLKQLNAPSLLQREVHAQVQRACESPAATSDLVGGGRERRPLGELMTGTPAEPGAHGVPSPLFAADRADPASVLDCALLEGGLLVQFPFASVVVGDAGEIRDVFATCGLRAVGCGADRQALFVAGGGGAASSGYFGAAAFVRDIAAHRWLTGGVPPALPRFVAGTIGDLKWSIVVDVVEGGGYRMAPRGMGDQCGGTFNSACGRYAWDGSHFVLDAATGAAVLDARQLHGDLRSFAKTTSGWRFVLSQCEDEDEDDASPPALVLVDERGAVLRSLANATAASLSKDGARLLLVSDTELRVVCTDTDVPLAQLDLRPLATALAVPPAGRGHLELWTRLLSAFAFPRACAGETPTSARAAIADPFGDDPPDEALAEAIEIARSAPPLPTRL